MNFLKLILSCVVFASLATAIGCAEECVETDEGGVCYDAYDYGYYYDSLVSGVAYEASNADGVMRTGVTGEDGDPGSFRFLDGQTVSFSIGDTALGETAGQQRVTPFDLADVTEEAVGGCDVDGALREDDFRIVHNLAVLLQTMDADGDPTTGIDISSDVAALFEGVSIDVDQAWEDFQADEDLQGVLDQANSQNLFDDTRSLREREEALGALYEGIGLCPAS